MLIGVTDSKLSNKMEELISSPLGIPGSDENLQENKENSLLRLEKMNSIENRIYHEIGMIEESKEKESPMESENHGKNYNLNDQVKEGKKESEHKKVKTTSASEFEVKSHVFSSSGSQNGPKIKDMNSPTFDLIPESVENSPEKVKKKSVSPGINGNTALPNYEINQVSPESQKNGKNVKKITDFSLNRSNEKKTLQNSASFQNKKDKKNAKQVFKAHTFHPID